MSSRRSAQIWTNSMTWTRASFKITSRSAKQVEHQVSRLYNHIFITFSSTPPSFFRWLLLSIRPEPHTRRLCLSWSFESHQATQVSLRICPVLVLYSWGTCLTDSSPHPHRIPTTRVVLSLVLCLDLNQTSS
jgi:hypothetical protein